MALQVAPKRRATPMAFQIGPTREASTSMPYYVFATLAALAVVAAVVADGSGCASPPGPRAPAPVVKHYDPLP